MKITINKEKTKKIVAYKSRTTKTVYFVADNGFSYYFRQDGTLALSGVTGCGYTKFDSTDDFEPVYEGTLTIKL